MKITLQSRRAERGSVLMVAIITGGLLGVVLASYLTLVHHQNTTVARSQAWNAALVAAEAGVEEALAQLNPGKLSTNINRSANGWTLNNGSYRPPGPRALLNGSYAVRFTDTVYPTIYSTGIITNEALKATFSRTIEVKTTNVTIFGPAITVLDTLNMNGNNFNTDSYNSTNAPYNPKFARANGTVASVNGIVYVNNATIRGSVLTGPNGTNVLKNTGLVGDMTWKGPGIQTSPFNHYANDFNVDFPDVALPNYSWLAPTASMQNKTVNGTTYNYIFPAGGGGSKTYYNSQINGLNGPIYVYSNSIVNLYITGDVKLTGKANMIIEAGGSLNIYMGGASFDTGSATIVNLNNSPLYFSYYGLPSNTAATFTGSASFYGSIYAPQANLFMGGGATFYGATVSKNANFTGDTAFHYDEALAGASLSRGYTAISWREL